MAEAWTPPQTIDPTSVKAVVTTKWAGTAYKSASIRRVEQYSISSQLDSDADPWMLDLGNPDADLNPIMVRDNEVRVEVFGVGTKGKVPLLTGLMDDAGYTEQGTIALTGRDMSCVATDSDHFPNIYRGLSPTKIIEMEARAIKCTSKFRIRPIVGGPKRQETDGSEKFWEFWYRMVRKDGYWIWMLADSTLVIDKLHYDYAPTYVFASAKVAKGNAIPVESFSWHKTTQGRIRKLAVEWRTQGIVAGTKPSLTILRDPGTGDWTKQANKLIQDKHAVSQKTAIKVGQEEIFETKVGAIEIVLTVADPGYLIQQDRIAHVDLLEYGIKGNWYVVGSTIRGDSSGFMQEVRLRERKFAISKKVPSDPVWTHDPGTGGGEPTGPAGKAVLNKMGNHPEWWDCYSKAAQKWRGLYDFALYMATLLAITDHETGFSNVRSNDENDGSGNTILAPGPHPGPEWYDIRSQNPTPAALDNWKTLFANQGGDGYVRWSCAVGPMQIFDTGLKQEADRMSGPVDEFFGGRWVPCNSIMVAAHKLNTVARTTKGSQDDLWAGVCLYGGYSSPTCAYGQDIRNRVLNDPGWLALVNDALSSLSGDNPDPGSGLPPGGGCDAQSIGWAQKVLNYMQQGKIKIDHAEDQDDIRRAAKGQPTARYNCCIDARVMATMIAIADKWGSMRTYAISSSHSDDSSGWGGHARGFAFDLNEAGGISFDGTYSDAAKGRDIEVLQWLQGYGAPDVRIIADNVGNIDRCDPDITQYCIPPFDRWGVTCKSHSNHIHICYTPGVPTT